MEINILVNMSVELLSTYGSDLTIVNVAKVSYGKESNQIGDKEIKLINYLVKHGHTSPFRHCNLQFRIQCPIYVERQVFKHAIGIATNSLSGRYVDFSDSYTMIEEWRLQSTDSKQGSAGALSPEDQIKCKEIEANVIEVCKKAYQDLIGLGVAKEQARSILCLNLNTTFIWTGSLQAFIHLCNLRLKPDAQYETRVVVQQMLDLVKGLENNPFKNSLIAFGY
jgi:thymidylate synthase (FAD)